MNLLWAPWKKPLNFRASWRRAPILEHGAKLSPEQEIILGFGSVWILGWRGEWPHPPHRGTNSTLCCPLKSIQSTILSHLMAATLDCYEQSSELERKKNEKAGGENPCSKQELLRLLLPLQSSFNHPLWPLTGWEEALISMKPFLEKSEGKLLCLFSLGWKQWGLRRIQPWKGLGQWGHEGKGWY